MFSCVICNELIGESTYSTPCGHIYHFQCIITWLNRSTTCPNCRNIVFIKDLIKLFMEEDRRYEIKSKQELEALVNKMQFLNKINVLSYSTVNDLKIKLDTSQNSLKESQETCKKIQALYENTKIKLDNLTKNEMNRAIDVKYNKEKSKNVLLKKEIYEFQSISASEINELKSEIANLKAKKTHYQSDYNYELPNTSKINAWNKNIKKNQTSTMLQFKFKPFPVKGFLSNCHFWIVNEYKELPDDSNHLYFNERRLIKHGATVTYHFSNTVTHVICNSQKNSDVLTGLAKHKKCVTDYWLSDVIGEKKILKPWLAHHFPIPYSYDNLPCEQKQIAILNFEKNEYYIVKAMAEFVGACINNTISHKTDVVITQKLEGEMIIRALKLKIPVVNVQWINDILLGEEIGVQDSNNTKYQQFDLSDPFAINCVRVSRLMEAWKDRSSLHCIEIESDEVFESSSSRKKIKTCFIHDFSRSRANSDNGDSNITSTSNTLQ